MIYALLGELEIRRGSSPTELPAGPALAMLVALLLHPNQSMSQAELIRAAWGDENVRVAQLHKRAGQVRKALAEVGRRGDLRTHSGRGYELRVAEEDLDSLMFLRLAREADQAMADGDTEAEIDLLRSALRLWRGPHPLTNVPGDAFRREIIALEQRHKRIAVRLFELELGRGGHERILDDLMQVAGYHPTDRRLCEQLMVAAYRCGHAVDATAAYERYKSELAHETGAQPDPALRDLHFAIVRGDDAVMAKVHPVSAGRAGAAAAQPVTVPHQLPPAPDLVGRNDLAAEVAWLLTRERRQAVPVVVISGPGGMGKTALAVHAAQESIERYPDGQLYLELRGTAGAVLDTGDILAQFLRAFGVPSVPDTVGERLAAYRTLLSERRVLLVLDDVTDGAQVEVLVPANPGSGVVITARQRLPEISGAHHVAPLEPLERPAATELFLHVVRRAGIDLETDPVSVDRIVDLCGGLPLALRIAGALRVHDHIRPTAELADRIAHQGHEALAYGQLSVARTIGAGFDRLDPSARQLFLGLGRLPLTEFALWTAAAVLDDHAGADAAAALSRLAARFMLQEARSEGRYRLHDLTHDYARRRAQAEHPDDTDALSVQAYRALLTLTRRAHAGLYEGDYEVIHSEVPDWSAPAEVLAEVDRSPMAWFEKERANIRIAVEHCATLGLAPVCWDLAVSAHEFYTLRGYFDDWYATHRLALRTCQDAGERRGEGIVVACLNQPALVASRRTPEASSPAELTRAAELLAACGERHGEAIALRTLANALRRRAQLARPLALFTRALSGYEASGDVVGRWQTLRFIGQTHLDRGDHAAAHRALADAERIAVGLGSARLLAQTRYWIGQARLAVGDLDGAYAAFEAVREAYPQETGVGHAYAAHGLGEVARDRGRYPDAARYLGVAGRLARVGADAVLEGRVWLSLAALHRVAGGPADQVVAALEQAVAVFAACGAAYLEIRALAALGAACGADPPVADRAWDRIDELYAAGEVPGEDRIHGRPARR